MGRDARARQLAGEAPRELPELPQLRERKMVKSELEAVRAEGRTPRLNFSDRAYLVDAHGTFRRVPIALRAPGSAPVPVTKPSPFVEP